MGRYGSIEDQQVIRAAHVTFDEGTNHTKKGGVGGGFVGFFEYSFPRSWIYLKNYQKGDRQQRTQIRVKAMGRTNLTVTQTRLLKENEGNDSNRKEGK